MTSALLLSIAVLGGIGLLGSVLLLIVSRRFHVDEDPRIAEIEALLPGANCGGCGRSGCHDFACACVAADSLEGLNCPGAAEGTMEKIAGITGLLPTAGVEPKVAVIKCSGSTNLRQTMLTYSGPRNCTIANAASCAGCSFGCLGCGDCIEACRWNAIAISPDTGLPVVDQDRCTGCGACIAACPRGVTELRPRGKRGLRVWVACNSRDRGPATRKLCSTGCIACGKCAKACPFDAITLTGNLAAINPDACRLCRKCVDECPTGAILTANFPVKQQ